MEDFFSVMFSARSQFAAMCLGWELLPPLRRVVACIDTLSASKLITQVDLHNAMQCKN